MQEDIAKGLLESKAITVNLENPFVFVSGTISPVYVDVRKLLSFPKVRDKVTDGFIELIRKGIEIEKIDVIAGGETAGIPFAAMVAGELKKPMIYVRKETKGYGQNKQIEGTINKGDRVLLVEDVITSGTTKVKFNIGIRSAGATMTDCICVFNYESEVLGIHEGREKLKNYDIKLHSLVDWDDVLKIAEEDDYFSSEELAQIRKFLQDPEVWGKNMGYE